MTFGEKLAAVSSVKGAKRKWPGVLDLGEIQDGGNPDYWKATFPGENPAEFVALCRKDSNWSAFWAGAAPHDCLRFYSKGAVADAEAEAAEKGWDMAEDNPWTFYSPGDASVEVFRRVVEGTLDSEQPTFALGTRRGVILFWRFARRAGESRRREPV